MPRSRRTPKVRVADVEAWEFAYLLHGTVPTGSGAIWGWLDLTADHGARARALWADLRDVLLPAWVRDHPGTRPTAWWSFTAPRWRRANWPERQRDLGPWATDLWPEPRLRLGGVGTPQHECLNVGISLDRGVPDLWVTPFDESYYNGRARDIHGQPIGTEYHEGDFAGRAIDPNDPPQFESEASYLERLALLLPGEARRLRAEDFEPEVVRPEAGDEAVQAPVERAGDEDGQTLTPAGDCVANGRPGGSTEEA